MQQWTIRLSEQISCSAGLSVPCAAQHSAVTVLHFAEHQCKSHELEVHTQQPEGSSLHLRGIGSNCVTVLTRVRQYEQLADLSWYIFKLIDIRLSRDVMIHSRLPIRVHEIELLY